MPRKYKQKARISGKNWKGRCENTTKIKNATSAKKGSEEQKTIKKDIKYIKQHLKCCAYATNIK